MILLRYFISIIVFLNIYTVVMGDLKKFSWRLKRNKKEELLEKFLMDAESHLMQNCPSRHTTVVASNNQLMRAATTIFKSRPYFVSIDPKILVKSREYVIENCVFVFVDTIDYDYLSTIFSHLPKHYGSKIQIVLTNNLPKNDIKNIFDLAYDKSMENITITFLENSEFKEFQVHPFTRNCQREARLSHVWVPDKGFESYIYDDYSPRNLNKCPVTISTLPLENTITVHENPNGILDVLGGPEGNLILTFAEKLNFTAILKYPEIQDWESLINNTVAGLVGEIINRKSLIAIGQLRPTVERHNYSQFTASYNHECLVWAVPVIITHREDVLYTEFPEYLWAVILMSIILSSIFIYSQLKKKSSNDKTKTYVEVTMDLISTTLGIPVHQLKISQPGEIYFLSYIFYALVLTAAYRTSLASILTVKSNVQLIKDYEDIVKSGMTIGGSNSSLVILQNQREESPHMPYLIEHYEIVLNIKHALDRIKYKKDFAYMRHLSTMQYYMHNLIVSEKEVCFYLFDDCIVSYNTVALVRKGFTLTNELNRIINTMRESGYIDLWNNNKINRHVRNVHEGDMKMQKLTLSQLQSIFVLYLSGIILSILTIILEFIIGIVR